MDKIKELWFITGSQHLYGEETLRQVAANSQAIVNGLNANPIRIVWKPTVKTAAEITGTIMAANADRNCIGIITWMHTFSPAKMWIQGLKKLQKPMLHFATQFNLALPFETIDMDFMNLNQAAHGDREFGYICTRLNLPRKVVVGHWTDPECLREIAEWSRVALAWDDAQTLKVARIGDNMRNVAVTEGNKVDAEITLGYSVNGYGICDVAEFVGAVRDSDIRSLVDEYHRLYTVRGDEKSVYEAARQELGIKADGKHTAEQFLQSYVTARVQKFLNDHGRKIIGWDEILEGELGEGATVMSWRGTSGGIKASAMGFDVIMTPNTYCYFDYYQSQDKDKEPFGIGGNLPVEKVYGYEPFDGLDEGQRKHILGVQANLWTEYITTPEHLEYMLLPRMTALSEIQWCRPEDKNLERYKAAMEAESFKIFDILGYNYRKF